MTPALHIPEALLKRLKEVPGFDEPAFLAAHRTPAVTSIRLHPQKAPADDADTDSVPWCPSGRYLAQRPVFTLDPAFHGGAYYVQEASSMFLDHLFRHLFPQRGGLRVLDLCAAPGGKSTLLASLLGSGSLLVANEVIRSRAAILEENITRWGYMNTWVTSNDPRAFAPLSGYFDAIVVDAPCSGSGLFRKDPAALDEWSEANVMHCSQRQRRILADIWPALKQHGMLIYATCSYSPEENEQVLDWLAASFHAAGVPVPVRQEWGITTTASPVHGMPGYRFFPDKVKGEGFFIAAIQKQDEAATVRYPRYKPNRLPGIAAQAGSFLRGTDQLYLPAADGHYAAIRPHHEPDLHLLRQYIFLRRTGLPLGKPAAGEWLPAHDLALSTDKSPGLPALDTTPGQALRFLRKEDLQLPSAPRGWYLLRTGGIALGWVKSLGDRYNNYLPKHWRIRMSGPGEEL